MIVFFCFFSFFSSAFFFTVVVRVVAPSYLLIRVVAREVSSKFVCPGCGCKVRC